MGLRGQTRLRENGEDEAKCSCLQLDSSSSCLLVHIWSREKHGHGRNVASAPRKDWVDTDC